MPTPRKPRTRKPGKAPQIDLVPVEPKRRRPSRTPPTYVMETRRPVQPTPRETEWVKARIVEATLNELSNVSVMEAATLIRAAIKGQPIAVEPVARLAVLGLLHLGLTVYDYLSPPADPPPPGTR